MSTGFKDQIAADLQKAKQVGGTKVEKIRKIFQDALSQTVTELKDGSIEIRTIAKDSKTTIFDTLKEPQSRPSNPTPVEIKIMSMDESNTTEVTPMENTNQTNPSEPISKPIVETIVEPIVESTGEINVDSMVAPTTELAIASTATSNPVASSTIVEVQPTVQPEAEAPSTSRAETTAQQLVETLKVLLDRAMNQFKQQEIYADIQQQMAKLKEQLEGLDDNLTSRYGDRYTHIKQDLQQDAQKAKAWYERTRTNAAESGSYWVDEKQADLDAKAGETGATIAQKEEKIKQLLKELWHTIRQ